MLSRAGGMTAAAADAEEARTRGLSVGPLTALPLLLLLGVAAAPPTVTGVAQALLTGRGGAEEEGEDCFPTVDEDEDDDEDGAVLPIEDEDEAGGRGPGAPRRDGEEGAPLAVPFTGRGQATRGCDACSFEARLPPATASAKVVARSGLDGAREEGNARGAGAAEGVGDGDGDGVGLPLALSVLLLLLPALLLAIPFSPSSRLLLRSSSSVSAGVSRPLLTEEAFHSAGAGCTATLPSDRAPPPRRDGLSGAVGGEEEEATAAAGAC